MVLFLNDSFRWNGMQKKEKKLKLHHFMKQHRGNFLVDGYTSSVLYSSLHDELWKSSSFTDFLNIVDITSAILGNICLYEHHIRYDNRWLTRNGESTSSQTFPFGTKSISCSRFPSVFPWPSRTLTNHGCHKEYFMLNHFCLEISDSDVDIYECSRERLKDGPCVQVSWQQWLDTGRQW